MSARAFSPRRWAWREGRGALPRFRLFLACLALGVAAIALIGLLRASFEAGLQSEGATLLGGDAAITLTYRRASAEERAFLERAALDLSEVITFRSMVTRGADGALAQVKAVDGLYPLKGALRLAPDISLDQALAADPAGLPGAVLAPELAARLGLELGESFTLGTQNFRFTARIEGEPDSASSGFALAPRVIVNSAALAQSGLLSPGALFDSTYRLALPEGAPPSALSALKAAFEAAFPESGMRWADKRRAAPGLERFLDRTADFLVLVGLSGLAVGGLGIQAAMRGYLAEKMRGIATLKSLGAPAGLIFRLYFWQMGGLALLGIGLGLGLAAFGLLALGPLIAPFLPFPLALTLQPAPLLEAAFYGLVTVVLFTLLPLARAEALRPAALYRGEAGAGRLRPLRLWQLAAVIAFGLGGALAFSGAWGLALGTLAGLCGALLGLWLAALGLRRLAALGARRLARRPGGRGRLALRLALGGLAAERAETGASLMALGLCLTVLATLGQIDANLRRAIAEDLPARAPSFFVLDIRADQIADFTTRFGADPRVETLESAPMLRGVIKAINGRPAREVAGDHWVLRGDRGLTYAEAPPPGTTLTEGAWWPLDYAGAPQVSFAAEEAAELGLRLGDHLILNVLGRDLEAEVTSFRAVDFRSARIGFVMVLNAAALRGAPHGHIATLYANPAEDAGLLRDVIAAFPNVTLINLREAAAKVAEAAGAIARATALAASTTLAIGLLVLVATAAAAIAARRREAALFKALGADRRFVFAVLALRAGVLGLVAGGIALGLSALAAFVTLNVVMEAEYVPLLAPALGVLALGVLVSLAATLAFAWPVLAARPAAVLRASEEVLA